MTRDTDGEERGEQRAGPEPGDRADQAVHGGESGPLPQVSQCDMRDMCDVA